MIDKRLVLDESDTADRVAALKHDGADRGTVTVSFAGRGQLRQCRPREARDGAARARLRQADKLRFDVIVVGRRLHVANDAESVAAFN